MVAVPALCVTGARRVNDGDAGVGRVAQVVAHHPGCCIGVRLCPVANAEPERPCAEMIYLTTQSLLLLIVSGQSKKPESIQC